MFDTNDPAVLWVVITNFAMGAVMLVCFILLGGAIARELLSRMRARTADDHSFAVPELGLTMADGGQREDGKEKPARRTR